MKTPLVLNKASKVLMGAALAATFVGCGMKSNPTSQYSELKDAVQPHEQKPVEQIGWGAVVSIDDPQAAFIWAVNEDRPPYLIIPSERVPGVKYRLELQDKPEGMELKPANDPKFPTAWALTWKPTAKDLGNETTADHSFTVIATPEVAPNSGLQSTVTVRKFFAIVKLGNDRPVFTSLKIQGKNVNSGQCVTVKKGEVVQVSATVRDPGSASGYAPEINVLRSRGVGSEGGTILAERMVAKSDAKPVAEGQFQFDLTLPTEGLDYGSARNEPIVPAVFDLSVESNAKLKSQRKQVVVYIRTRGEGNATCPAVGAAPANGSRN